MKEMTSKNGSERLLVIVPDILSELIKKGEITERYYNPGNLFNDVHILLINDDKPDLVAVQKMVGNAGLHIHNLPGGVKLFKRTLGWRPLLLNRWAQPAVELAKQIKPSLVRCHGNHLNTFVASKIKKQIGIPYIISMHINPDLDVRYHEKQEGDWKHRIYSRLSIPIEKIGIQNADVVVCVYKFIISYAKKFKAKEIEVIYNAVNPDNLLPKENYALSLPVKIIVPGRQFIKKDPSAVLEAIVKLDGIHCTLVGDGPYHERLRNLSIKLGISERCHFIKSMPNDELCKSLRDYDVLISVNDYGGVSKAELEAALVGMPIITNAHPLESEPEILGKNCLVVDGSPGSYRSAIKTLIENSSLRETIGRDLRTSAAAVSSSVMEQRYCDLYKKLLKKYAI